MNDVYFTIIDEKTQDVEIYLARAFLYLKIMRTIADAIYTDELLTDNEKFIVYSTYYIPAVNMIKEINTLSFTDPKKGLVLAENVSEILDTNLNYLTDYGAKYFGLDTLQNLRKRAKKLNTFTILDSSTLTELSKRWILYQMIIDAKLKSNGVRAMSQENILQLEEEKIKKTYSAGVLSPDFRR